MSHELSRWTYTLGTRPEGCIEYDEPGLKFHSHHDSDPARGQHSAWDLVRLHKFTRLDAGSEGLPVVDRPSHRAMVQLAESCPEIRASRSSAELEDLGELPDAGDLGGQSKVNAGSPSRFTVYSASEFSSGAPLEWLVRRVLPRAELAVIFGESGSGKSFLALDICAAITRGIEWRANRTVRGGVVYVCAEGARGFKARLRAYAHEHKVGLAELPAVIADAPNLLEPKDAAALITSVKAWVAEHGQVDVVVLDTMAAVSPGGNENSSETVGLILSHCKLLSKETGALVVLIHHSGKDSTKGARGWSGLRAAADAEIEITRNGDYRAAAITKLKDFEDGATFAFKLKVIALGVDADGEPESSCVIEHVDRAPDVSGGGKQRATGRHQLTMYDILKVMAPSGTVNYDDLVAGYVAKMPKGGEGRDNRKRDAKRAIEELITKRLAHMHAEDRVSLTSLVTSGDDGWLG